MATAPKKLTGDFAQVSVGSDTFTATTTSASAVLSNVASPPMFAVGQPLSGTGIPANAKILSINALAATITMTLPATASATGVTITASEVQVIGLSDWSLDWKRKMVDATTTDDSSYESFLGSSASWTVKAKHMYYDGDPSQLNAILAAIGSPQGATMWNFFVDVQNSDLCYNGLAYVEGITLQAGVGKAVGLDVSLKGSGPLYPNTENASVTNNTTGQQQAED